MAGWSYQMQRDFFLLLACVTGDSQSSGCREALPREAETMLSHPSSLLKGWQPCPFPPSFSWTGSQEWQKPTSVATE